MKKGFINMFNNQNKIIKYLFRLAMFFLIIGVGSLVGFIIRDVKISNEQIGVETALSDTVNKLDETELTSDKKSEIISAFEKATNGQLSYLAIYRKKAGSPEFTKGEEFPKIYNEMNLKMEYGFDKKFDYGFENKSWYGEVGYNGSSYLGTYYAIPYSLLTFFCSFNSHYYLSNAKI